MDIKEKQLEYLITTHESVRGEIQMRIGQRDSFAVQFLASGSATLALGWMNFKFAPFLFFLLPLITLFFSVQILYSYTIHDRCHKFLTEEIEPAIANILQFKSYKRDRLMWECYCKDEAKRNTIKNPGIRKSFFEKFSLLVPLFASGLFLLVSLERNTFSEFPELNFVVAAIGFVLLQILNTTVILSFNKSMSRKAAKSLAERDYFLPQENAQKCNRVVFLDRDGTIHKDKVNTHKIEDLEYFNDTFSAVKTLYDLGFSIVLVTNQDGIARGIYTATEMHALNQKIISDFREHGIAISAVYYSPHTKFENSYSFKPNPGMLLRAKYELNINMENSFMIGDQVSDIVAAYRANVPAVLVTTGIYRNDYAKDPAYIDIVPPTFSTLTACAEYIKKTVS